MADLTTLSSLKSYLGMTDSIDGDDELLSSLITAYSKYMQTWMSRNILSATYEDVFDGGGNIKYFPKNYPIRSVSSVIINGQTINASSNDGSGYVFNESYIGLKGYSFVYGMLNVRVVYNAGYVSVPADLAQACNELVALRYKEIERIGEKTKILAGEQVTYITDAFPSSVKTILTNYRRVF